MISSERTAEIFRALNLHYEDGSYDYFKYRGRLKIQPKNVSKPFEIIANRLQTQTLVEDFFIANMSNRYTLDSGNLSNIMLYANKGATEHLDFWQGFNQYIDQNFVTYVKSKTRLKALLDPSINGLPLMIHDTIQRKVPIDILSNMLYHFKSLEEKWNLDDPLAMDMIRFAKQHAICLEKKEKISTNLPRIIANLDK